MSATESASIGPGAADEARAGDEGPPPRRIGLLGGSFNPPHLGHLALARAALAQLGLTELRWLPAGAPWQKPAADLAPAADRAAMVAALIDGEPGMRLDARELQRAGPTYTLDTVRDLQREDPDAEWVLVIGQDQYAGLHTWHQPAELLSAVTLAVAARHGQSPTPPAPLAGLPHRPLPLDMPRVDVSATELRARVAASQPIAPMVGEAVARYIDQHSLYRARPGH